MSAIKLKTKLPGPKSTALMEERRRHVARGPFHTTSFFIKSAKGAILEDVDGNFLLDFGSGIAVTNTGHCPNELVLAVQKQAERFLHTSFNITPYESYIRLAESLNKLTPGSFAKKTFLANSGAEAVENAIKIARVATKRQAVVCFDHAFHGRTYMAMSLTAKTKPYRYGFAPFNSEVYRAPFPYEYRWNMNGNGNGPSENVSQECFAQFEALVQNQIGADQVAAVILEPVLGEGGFVAAPVQFMKMLREFCTKNGILLIADEIQTGFGRTGKMFAFDHYGVEPDMMTLAKGMGGGMPISAVTGRAEVMDAVGDGGIGGTFGGNPLSCEAALAVIDMFKNQNLLDQAQRLGETIKRRLENWKEKYPVIGDVRGLGPMRGIEFVKDRKTKEPNKDAVTSVLRHCHERGLVVLSAGTFGNVIRLLPPLTIQSAELEEGLNVMEGAIGELRL